MKILICGAGGQLGYDCTRVLGEIHDITAVDIDDLDITDTGAVRDSILRFSPDIVINCAAFTKVDDCETEKALAWKVNVEGPENLALCVEKYGGKLVHISTDYVFDGRKDPPDSYAEDDQVNPISFYGKTKLEGELAVRRTTERHIIVRTAWVFGIKGHNFLKTMLKLALKDPGNSIKVVNDQFGSPTWSYSLSVQIEKLIKANGLGTYHATSGGYCSWYELAGFFLGRMDIEHSLIPCSTDDFPTPAARPHNSILENRRLKEAGINIMQDWKAEVERFVEKFRAPLFDEVRSGLQKNFMK
jgi:dTDP-4-dehydrorhamnose reductase